MSDAYKLHVSIVPAVHGGIVCEWEKLNLLLNKEAGWQDSGRFFHAACATLNIFPADDHSNDEYDLVVVHGGVTSIHDPYSHR